MLSLKNKVKKAILGGGIVVAPMRSGKSTCLLEILHADTNAVIITLAYVIAKNMEDEFKRRFGYKSNRIFGSHQKDLIKLVANKKVFVDEYFWNDYRGEFFAAVSSPSCKITLIKPNKKLRAKIWKMLGKTGHREAIIRDFCMF